LNDVHRELQFFLAQEGTHSLFDFLQADNDDAL